MAAIFLDSCGPHIIFSINHLRKKDVNEPCYKTTELKLNYFCSFKGSGREMHVIFER